MNTQGLLLIAMVAGALIFAKATANLEQFPDVTYEDIENLNATCPEGDNCREERNSDNLESFNCNCEEFCTQYDTCCVDSKYREKERKIRKPYKCVNVYGTKHLALVIDSCDPTWSGDNHTEELCTASPDEKEDLFLALPVTSHKTGTTYRNYYCAVCNNETDKDQVTLWHMSLSSRSRSRNIESLSVSDLHFHRTEYAWVIGNETNYIFVDPYVRVPDEIKEMVHNCENVISRCADDWNDTIIEGKCSAYMAIIRIGLDKKYRNPHCALCNHESLEYIGCYNLRRLFKKYSRKPSNTFFVRLFSIYDKESKCSDDQVYDTIAQKCRKVFKG